MTLVSVTGLVNNAALLLAIGLIYDMIGIRPRGGKPSLKQFLTGFILGGIGIAIMLNPWEFMPGVVFDTRSVLLCISGLFFGTVPTLSAVLITSVFRYDIGGVGVWTGIGVIVTSGAIGLAWRHLRNMDPENLPLRDLYFLGFVVHLAMLFWMFTLPWPVAKGVLSNIGIPVMLLFPVTTTLLGWLMMNRGTRKLIESSLRHERDLIERMMETSPAGIVRVDAAGLIVYANNRAEKILGICQSEAEGRTYDDPNWKITDFKGNPFPEKNLPFNLVKQTAKSVMDIRHAIEWPDGRRVLLSINAAPLFNEHESFDGIVATIEDITEKLQTEQNYQMLFREMIDGFALHEILCDHHGHPVDYRFLAVNPAFERLTGLTGKDLIGKTVLEILPGTERYWIESYGQVALTGKPVFFENYSQDLDRYFQVSAFSPAKNQFACIFVDITERKNSERALWESKQVFEKVFNSQLDAIFVLNSENPARILECNEAATKIFGYTAEAMSGETIDKLHVSDSHRKTFLNHLNSAVEKHGHLSDFEFQMKRKDGTVFPSEHTMLELKNDAGERIGWVAVVRDLTLRKEMESRLQQAQKMEAIGCLAGGIAHDFNNLLFPIVGMSELLLEDLPAGSSEAENVKVIFKSAIRGSELVKQILAFSRQSDHEVAPVQAQLIIKEVIKLCRSTIPNNIKIRQNIQSDCGWIRADPTQLHQVAMNLITNAYHAVEEAAGEIIIELKEILLSDDDLMTSPLEPGHYALLSVSDTGYGIDPKIMNKIFEPYFTTKEKGKGTGLGLAMVYGIVKEHRGDIKVYSESGKGTTVNVYLPIAEKSSEKKQTEKAEFSQTGNERILLVEDEEPIAKLEQQMLERLGYTPSLYLDSGQALEAFRKDPHSFDLVITDMAMPKMTGEQLTNELISIRPDIPVIICTGFSKRIDDAKAAAMGASGFLMKPVIKSEMAEMIRKVLGDKNR